MGVWWRPHSIFEDPEQRYLLFVVSDYISCTEHLPMERPLSVYEDVNDKQRHSIAKREFFRSRGPIRRNMNLFKLLVNGPTSQHTRAT